MQNVSKEVYEAVEQLKRSRDNALKNMEQWKHEANALRSLLKALMEETERSGDDQSRAYYDAARAIKGST